MGKIQHREVGGSKSPWYTGEVYSKTGELIEREDGADKDDDEISFECARSGFGGSGCPDKYVSVVISGIQSSIWQGGDAGKRCCVVSGGELGACEGNIPSSLTFDQLECLADLTCKRSNEKCYAKNVEFEQVQIETPSALMAVSSKIQHREVARSKSSWYTGEVYLKTGELIKRQDGADKDKDAISFECAKSGFGGSACPEFSGPYLQSCPVQSKLRNH